MHIHELTLEGFVGIHKGLGQTRFHLNLDALVGDAKLVALQGANGRGKSTILDNLHPYLTMPSRATPGGAFSYYDHIQGPRGQKILLWSAGGKTYRSEVVIINERRRKTEAYLFERQGERWCPVTLIDGTVVDGRQDVYTRCIEAILGSEQTFLTAVFCAQGRRALSSYRNAEIKALLADLLGLDAIQALGQRAQDTVRLFKAQLNLKRLEVQQVAEHMARRQTEIDACHLNPGRQADVVLARQEAAKALHNEQIRQAQQANLPLRVQWQAQRQALLDAARRQQADLKAQLEREVDRLKLLRHRLGERQRAHQAHLQEQARQRERLTLVLRGEPQVRHACRRIGLAQQAAAIRRCRRDEQLAQVQRLKELDGILATAKAELSSLEREAGQLVLRRQEIERRSELQNQVPCAVLPNVSSVCPLLADARAAHALQPGVIQQLQALGRHKDAVQARIHDKQGERHEVNLSMEREPRAAEKLALAEARLLAYQNRCAQRQMIQQAREDLFQLDQMSVPALVPSEMVDIADAEKSMEVFKAQMSERQKEAELALATIDAHLARLPPIESERDLLQRMQFLQDRVAQAEAEHLTVLQKMETLRALEREMARLRDQHHGLTAAVERLEVALGQWSLFAKCMSNDGLIALAIDEAGPTLSALANDLLRACYGPRFTVSIRTLLETSRGSEREGFEIVVLDGQTGQGCPVGLMSGGEKTWVHEALSRGIALYLAQASGRQYATLFTDETDGALDPERKRMFMAMKREVLHLGGYAREIFVSQTPELTGMADVVISLDSVTGDRIGEAIAPSLGD